MPQSQETLTPKMSKCFFSTKYWTDLGKPNLECAYFENVRTVNLLVSWFMDAYLLLKTTNPQKGPIITAHYIRRQMIALCRYALLAQVGVTNEGTRWTHVGLNQVSVRLHQRRLRSRTEDG